MFYRITGTDLKAKREKMMELARAAFAEGRRVYILVPEQATALYERAVLEACGPASSLLVEVTCFSRLMNLVGRSWGELSQKSITEEEKKLLLSRIVREKDSLFPHLPLTRSPDGIEALLSEMEELVQAGLTPERAEEIAREHPEKTELSQTLTELLLAHRLLRSAMGKAYSDPAMEEEKLARILTEYDFFRDSCVLLDLFWDFTAPQERILERILATAHTVAVSFLLEREGSLFHRAKTAHRHLLRLAARNGVPSEEIPFSLAPREGGLSLLRQNLAVPRAPEESIPSDIRLVECADKESEGAFVADAILEKVHKGGARWQDFAVLARSEGELFELTQALLAAEIPFFCEEKKPLATSRLARTLLLATRLATGLASDETLRNYLTFGLFRVDPEGLFLLEKYVATWHLYPSACLKPEPFVKNPDGYQTPTERSQRELERINRVKEEIFSPLRELTFQLQKGTVEEKVTALVSFLTRIGAEKSLKEKMAQCKKEGKWEEAAEAVQEWNTVLSRLSGLARALGGEREEGKEFYSLLSLTLSGSLPGHLPQGRDRVQLGRVDFMRPTGAKHLFLVGMNTGVFPAEIPRGKFLSQRDREFLSRQDLPLSHAEAFADDESFYFYLSCLFAEESLTLSARSQGGVSLFFKEVQRLFPRLTKEVFSPEGALPRTPQAAFRFVVEHAQEDSPLVAALSEYLAGQEGFANRQLQSLAGKAFLKQKPRLAEELPYENTSIGMSYSRMEQYTKCPYSYFAAYLLEAREDQEAEVAANVKGNFVHRVLEKVLSTLTAGGKKLSEVPEGELKLLSEKACGETIEEMLPGTLPPDVAYLVRRLKKTSFLILRNMREEFALSAFAPLYFEKDIKDLGGYEIPLDDGTFLRFSGNIDRVDLYRSEDGENWVRVIDYKTGGHDFKWENVASGLSLQMLLYLFSLWGKSPDPKDPEVKPFMPAGILYMNGMDEVVSCSSADKLEEVRRDPYYCLGRDGMMIDREELICAADPEGDKKNIPFKKENFISLEALGFLKNKVEKDFARLAKSIKAGEISPSPLCKKDMDGCTFCPYLPLCRREKEDRRLMRTKVPKSELFGEEKKESKTKKTKKKEGEGK